MPDTPDLTQYERRLVASALKFYGDQMPAYAAAVVRDRAEFAAVMEDVKTARLLRVRFEEPHDA
jgi:hypothetical protein